MIILMPANLTVLPDENLNSTVRETVWAYDGNLKYWDGEHISLFVFAIFILTHSFWYPTPSFCCAYSL